MVALKLLIFALAVITIFLLMDSIGVFVANYFEGRKLTKYNIIKFKNFISIYKTISNICKNALKKNCLRDWLKKSSFEATLLYLKNYKNYYIIYI